MYDRDEVWAEVPGFPKYAISNYGHIHNMQSRSPLKGRKTVGGRLKVVLSNGDSREEFYIHHLVAAAFMGDYRPSMRIRHYDGDATNNHVSNLRPIGPFQKRRQRYSPAYKRGSRVRIVETGEVFKNAYELARYLRTDTSAIYRCMNGERASHLGYSYERVDDAEGVD